MQKIGFEKVNLLNIQHGGGYNLVGKEQRPIVDGRVWQHECDGWYVYTNTNNKQKCADLQKISDHYRLKLKIEEGGK